MAYGDASQPGTWRRYVYQYMPDMFRRYWGVRFGTGMIGGLWDRISQALVDSVTALYVQEENGPAYDALRPLGNEMSMPQYATETWLQYRSRLRTAWETWDKAGSFGTIVDQLALAGLPDAQVFRFSESGSWSEFVVFYPNGAHPVTDFASYFGSGATFGDGTIYGPNNLTAEQLRTYKDLILHWKPADWKCPYIIFEVSGETYGTGHTFGEAGLTYGGEQIRVKVQ